MKTLTEKQQTKANNIRESCAGYIGGKYIASWATDEQIIRLCDLQDQIGVLHNRKLEIEKERDFIQNEIKSE